MEDKTLLSILIGVVVVAFFANLPASLSRSGFDFLNWFGSISLAEQSILLYIAMGLAGLFVLFQVVLKKP